MSSVGEAPRGHNPTAFGPNAPQDEGKSSSTSTSSSSSSYEMILLPSRRKTKRKNPTIEATG
jgi:hypothetical protein